MDSENNLLIKIKNFQRDTASHLRGIFSHRSIRVMTAVLVVCAVAFVLYTHFYLPPRNFPKGAIVTVDKGATVEEIGRSLKEQHVVRSPIWFRAVVVMTNSEDKVRAGKYMFDRPLSVFDVAQKIIKGDFNIAPEKITIPEGANVFEIATILDRRLDGFNTSEFIRLARPREGYLFPDTYFFLGGSEPQAVVDIMEHTFWKKISELEKEIDESGKSIGDIVTMASLIEREASSADERKMISGILWKRIDEEMLLQVDAAFAYVNGKNSFTLTKNDLTSTSSPYNTYTNLGLPPGPIANPGLDAIEAALYPEESTYYFYLHGGDGEIRYASTYAQHKANIKAYLD